MPVQITIRNVPDEVRDVFATRAARKRQSMQAYLLTELERIASKPTNEEVLDGARARLELTGTRISSETIVNAIKEGRERDFSC